MEVLSPPRTLKRFALDWAPILLILVAYAVLHELAETMVPRAHVDPQLWFDEWVFGTVPTVTLQRDLWTGRNALHWYDYVTWLVYLSHFVVTLTIAVVLWVVAYPRFIKFRALILTVTFAGFATYLLYPAFPPWLASERGDMPNTVRVVREVWLGLGLDNIAAVFGAARGVALHDHAVLLVARGALAHPARRVRARDGVHARVHRRPLRVRHPHGLGVRDRRLRGLLLVLASQTPRPGGLSDAKTGGHPSMRRPLR